MSAEFDEQENVDESKHLLMCKSNIFEKETGGNKEVCVKSEQGSKVFVADQQRNAVLVASEKNKKRKGITADGSFEKNITRKKRKYTRRKKPTSSNNKLYGSYYMKFGWGIPEEKLTKEQLQERTILKAKCFKRNVCPYCKTKFRIKHRAQKHIENRNCSCRDCGMIYECAFERSDHKQKCGMKNLWQPTNVNAAKTPLVEGGGSPTLFSTPRRPTTWLSSTLALRRKVDAFRSESEFSLPSFNLDFGVYKTERSVSPNEDTFSLKLEVNEPIFDLEDIAKPITNPLEREIKNLLLNDQVEIISDF